MAKPVKEAMILLAVLLALAPGTTAVLLGGGIINNTDGVTSLFFDTASDAYADNVAGVNPNVKLRINGTTSSDVANKFVGALYAVGTNSSNLQHIIITTAGGNNPLTQTGSASSCGAGCFQADTSLSLAFASIIVGSGSGNPGAAFFPSNIFIVVSSDNQVDQSDNFIFVSDAKLKGSYTISSFTDTYNQTTGNVSVDITGVTGTTTTGSVNILTEQPSYGNKNFILLGICTDTHGENCSGTTVTNISGGAVQLSTGVTSPPDTGIINKTILVNGESTTFCIGPDVDVTSLSSNQSSGLPGTKFNFTATVTNGNNVDVTQTFNINFTRSGVQFGLKSITGLAAGSSKTVSAVLDTTGLTSGSVTATATPFDLSIGDCNNGNDPASTSVTLTSANLIKIFIDGNETTTFPDAGRPYNITVMVNDTDGNALNNITIRVSEINGINLFAPTQTFTQNAQLRGVTSKSIAETTTDDNGTVIFAVFPTGNTLYEPQFAFLNVTKHVGNYSLFVQGIQSGSALNFLVNGTTVNNITLTLSNLSIRQPTGTEIASINITNQESFIETIYTNVNQAFAAVQKWLVP